MAGSRRFASQTGQSTVEWVGLVGLVSAAIAALAAIAGLALPGAALAHAVGQKLICAVGLSDSCLGTKSALELAYGPELAGLAVAHAPTIRYEPGMRALPVDPRRCREDSCADGAESGEVWRSRTGEPTVAFLRVIDCRQGAPAADPSADCGGERAAHVYLQYWLYYPGSATAEGSTPLSGLIREVSAAAGSPTYHADDWESFTVRLGPEGADQRASAHHGYGVGWVPETGQYFVSGGSHAGSVLPRDFDRTTPPDRLTLIPLEAIPAEERRMSFAVTPPWLKKVWSDPEYEGTD